MTERTDLERPAILGRLDTADGKGVVRITDHVPTDIEDLWSALTEPDRLARWIGKVEGELHEGGEYRAHWTASGWSGTGWIDRCEPPRRLVLRSREDDGTDIHDTEITLTPEGDDRTLLVLEQRGMPMGMLSGYGVGNQLNVEALVAYVTGSGPVDNESRFPELMPDYERLAADV